MLYRYAGEPDGTADLSAYTDAGSVSAYAEKGGAVVRQERYPDR